MTEQQIIDMYNRGDREKAFGEIVSAYSERLYWYVRRMGLSHEDTDDLLQEIFVKVWTALPSFRRDSRLYTWIYRIATNETLNLLRSRKVRASLSFASLDDGLESKVEDDPYFNGNEAQRILLKAIDSLPEKQKLVFTMRYYDEMKYEDISEILGTSVGALKASYHFAYEKVKAELKSHF